MEYSMYQQDIKVWNIYKVWIWGELDSLHQQDTMKWNKCDAMGDKFCKYGERGQTLWEYGDEG